MGMFDEFLGKGDGYTRAQRTGLQRSAVIKKRRKEEERAFEISQEREKGRRALTERSMMEAGETQRAGIRVAGDIERERMSNVGLMARQGLVERQGVETATTKAIREANVASMKHARGLTTADIKHGRDVELAKIKAKDPFAGLFEASPGAARTGLGKEAEASKSILTGFLAKSNSEKRAYMKRLQKEDPDAYLSLAKQYKMWSAPKKESASTELGDDSIYRSPGGTYRNF